MPQRPRLSIFNSSPSTPISSWLPSWRGRDQYTSLPASGSTGPKTRTTRRKVVQAATAVSAVLLLLGIVSMQDSTDWDEMEPPAFLEITYTTLRSLDPNWGMTEQQGWKPDEQMGLADLGWRAEERYRYGFEAGTEGSKLYFQQLHDFATNLSTPLAQPILASLTAHLPPSISSYFPKSPRMDLGPPSMIAYKTIHQTDKTRDSIGEMTEEWVSMNQEDGWKLNFLDDSEAWAWVGKTFPDTDVMWAWSYMHRGVLRADFLRYLLPLVEGGVYSDVDTRPIRRIEDWGKLDVEFLDLSDTDGKHWKRTLSRHPSVVVSIDVNVHARMDWWQQWPRAVGICQWTLSGAPYHPIYVDAARRVVNSTRVVEAWDNNRLLVIQQLEEERPDGWEERVADLRNLGKDHAMSVMEWTGPGLFSDAVLAFLLARYNVTWHRLRGIDHPLRVGDVLILPITGFSPGGEPDFGAEGPDSPQANVVHNFRGSWKPDGAR